MAVSRLLLVSDNVKRYSDFSRKAVKHCVEIEWHSGNGDYGGVGFGEGDMYVRYTPSWYNPGSNDVNIISGPQSYISMKDQNRILICLDSTISPNVMIVRKGEINRTTLFTFNNTPKKLSLLTYSYGSHDPDLIYVFTNEKDFQNEMPSDYSGWFNGVVKSCYHSFHFETTVFKLAFFLTI